jgi:hypothetical protein
MKIDEFQFLTCLQHQIWGSKTRRFKKWNLGDHLVFIVDKAIAGLAEVSGEPFLSSQLVFEDDLYPYRIPIKFVQVMLPEHRPTVLGEIRDTLISEAGTRYTWLIIGQHPFSGTAAKTIIDYILSSPNDLPKIQTNLKRLLAEAKAHRVAHSKQ